MRVDHESGNERRYIDVINAISNSKTTTPSTPSAADYMKQTTGLSSDDFMKLFITQLQHQDPTAPQDAAQMVAQMAQLTQVEQAYNANTNLKSILTALNGASGMSAVSYIGKNIAAQGSQVNLVPGSQPQLNFNLPGAANKVQVAVQDASGRTVRTLTEGSAPAGDGCVTWDGRDSNNSPMPAGLYSFTVTGFTADGKSFSGTPLVKGVVTGVKLDQGTPVLTAGGIDMPLANVTAVTGGL